MVPTLTLLLVTPGSLLDHVARGEEYTGTEGKIAFSPPQISLELVPGFPPPLPHFPPKSEASGTLVDLLVGKILYLTERIFSRKAEEEKRSLRAEGGPEKMTKSTKDGTAVSENWHVKGNKGQNGYLDGECVEEERERLDLLKLLEGILLFSPSLWSPPEGSEQNPVARAARAGDCALLGVLIGARAPVNGGSGGGDSPLIWALAKVTHSVFISRLCELVRGAKCCCIPCSGSPRVSFGCRNNGCGETSGSWCKCFGC